MSQSARHRLEKVEATLTPTQRVLAWLDEAHAFGGLSAYVDSLLDQPSDAYPINRLARDVAEAARAGQRVRSDTDSAIRNAVRATMFRYELVLRINVVSHEMIEREALIYAVNAGQAAVLAMDDREKRRRDQLHLGRLATLRDLAASRVDELGAAQEARSVVEMRYLEGHAALFPDDAEGWGKTVQLAQAMAEMTGRLAELDGVDPVPASSEETHDAKVASLIADLVEPSRVMALKKLDEGQRAFTIATTWLRTKVQPPSAVPGFSASEVPTL